MRDLKPPKYVLERHYGSAVEIQEVFRVHWWHLPDTADQGANEGRCSVGPHTNKE